MEKHDRIKYKEMYWYIREPIARKIHNGNNSYYETNDGVLKS